MSLAAGGGRRRDERKLMSVFKKLQRFWGCVFGFFWVFCFLFCFFLNKAVSHGGVSELVQAGCFSEAGI